MKVMFPEGACCDLACYPICPGYSKEGCLMFGNQRSFMAIWAACVAGGLFVHQLPFKAGGMWAKNSTIVLGKDMKAPVYGDEYCH